ncbi:MAG: 5-methyltetrahydropteroyltriglutamate--homocysteine S-methyltransferase [Alphaproteobacteria bacterium]|nr:5-methyltetrahydropteroyltriglutamate--homocysteine S-methyltransferase [Alphaproteobacteria bacterium]
MNASTSKLPPFRAEHVGSLLRPRRLKDAFKAAHAGDIGAGELEDTLADCIREAIALQEDCGMQAITDGEFRRGSWFLGFVEAVGGLTTRPSKFAFSGQHSAWECPFAEARLQRGRGIVTDDYAFIASQTGCTPKVTMPSPTAMHFWRGEEAYDSAAYEDRDAFFEDLAGIYRAELAALSKLGCTYVQLDEVPIAMLCDPKVQAAVRKRGEDPDALLARYIAVINAALAGRPTNLTVAMHLCRGNYKGQWMAEGGYAPVAETLFQGTNVNAFFLEYDSERAGDFTPLRAMPEDKNIVLGLVCTKKSELESTDDLKRRIEEASRFAPLERLAISPQCGFASSAGGNPVTEDDQRRKLTLVANVAETVWG